MRLVKLTWKTNWACYLLKDGYFLLLSEYFIAIYPFSLSLSSSVWYGNLYFSRESSILSERSRELAEDPHDFQWNKKCSWAWKSLVLLLQGTDFFSFSPSHFSSVCFFFFWCPKVARLCSAFFFSPSHNSCCRNPPFSSLELQFTLLVPLSVIIQSPYSRNPFTFWTTFVIPFFVFSSTWQQCLSNFEVYKITWGSCQDGDSASEELGWTQDSAFRSIPSAALGPWTTF